MQTRKTATTDSKASEFWTPESPRMDPVKTVRNATTDGISRPRMELLELTGTPNVEVGAGDPVEEGEAPEHEVVEAAAEEENATSIGSLAMTKRKPAFLPIGY